MTFAISNVQEFEQITQSYQEEDSECDESEEELMAKITNEDDAVLRAALINVGASRVLRGIEDMDPMLEDVEVRHRHYWCCYLTWFCYSLRMFA